MNYLFDSCQRFLNKRWSMISIEFLCFRVDYCCHAGGAFQSHAQVRNCATGIGRVMK